MRWKVTTPPSVEPVTADDLVAQFRGDPSDVIEWDLLTSYVTAAREFCENHMDRSVASQTITLALDAFPGHVPVVLPRPPVVSIESVTYTNEAGANITVASSVYGLDDFSDPPAVFLRAGESWPTDVASERNAVRIEYVAGYADGTVPKSIAQAITLLAAHWEANREAVFTGSITKEIEFAVTALLGQRRMMSV